MFVLYLYEYVSMNLGPIKYYQDGCFLDVQSLTDRGIGIGCGNNLR